MYLPVDLIRCLTLILRVRFMVFNTTFKSIITWWSVILVEETGVPGKNH